MDPFISSVATGVIANGLTSVIGRGASSLSAQTNPTAERAIVRAQQRRKQNPYNTPTQTIQAACASIVRSGRFNSVGRPDNIAEFLLSPEVETVVRQIFAAELIGEKAYISDVKTRFFLLVELQLHLSSQEKEALSEVLFTAVLEGVRDALAVEVELGSLAAASALNALRSNVLRDEIRAVRKSIDVLQRESQTSFKEILLFEKKFRDMMNARHSVIVPPHLGEAQKVKLDDLYVSPVFVESTEREGEVTEALGIPEMLRRMHRTVILGNPGGGKSTLATKLCFDLSKDREPTSSGEHGPTPILVILREYVAEKKERQLSILQYINENAHSSYQTDPPQGAIEYLLLNGRALVVFDGLDELLETNQRQRVTAEVESFCRLYPSTPVLVTSREVGYEQAPLDPRSFEVFRLAPFNEGQAREYVEKWFKLEADGRPGEEDRKLSAFWTESASVPDLRTNPLMLGLMCTIYREEKYIPRNRPDVYRKCAEMMFDRWDRKREIPVRFRFETDFRPALAYLAHWIYSEETLQAGVTEDQLILRAADYLTQKKYDDRDEAEAHARDFVEHCRDRAWVFTNTGSNDQGVELYQFTHRTFLEYFTALYLHRTHETADALAEVLIPKLVRREWDTVSQLAFQIKNSETEGGGDRLLKRILAAAREASNGKRWALLSFAARCLEFLVPSPPTVRSVAKYSAERVIARLATEPDFAATVVDNEAESENRLVSDTVAGLVWVAPENRPGVTAGLKEAIVEANSLESDSMRVASFEVGLSLRMTSRAYIQSGMPTSDPPEYFLDFSEQLAETYKEQIVRLSRSDFSVAFDACLRGQITPEQMKHWHGRHSLFRERHYSISGSDRVSLCALAALWSMSFVQGGDILDGVMLGILRLMGEVVPAGLENPVEIAGFTVILNMAVRERTPPRLRRDLDGEALYGLFWILAHELEHVYLQQAAQRYLDGAEWGWAPFGNLIERWLEGGEIILDERLSMLWTEQQISTAVEWATKGVPILSTDA